MTLDELKAYLRTHAKSRADIWNGGHRWAVAERAGYGLGGEGYGFRWGGFLYKGLYKLMRWDCSGDYYGLAKLTDEIGRQTGLGPFPWSDGKTFRRTNAAGYWQAGVPVVGEPHTADFLIYKRPKSKKPHHIVHLTCKRDGQWRTGESRRGLEEDWLDSARKRPYCIGLYRLPWTPDMGEVTIPRILKRGDTGDEVKAVQTHLVKWLGPQIPIDGIFGQATETAVRLFQKLLGLANTGKADFPTHAALDGQTTWPNLFYGSWGRLVGRVLKWNMNRFGAKQNPNSWTLWHNTEDDLRAIQAAHGLPVTGVCDEPTWNLLLS